jgi:hypothetical protein
MLKVSGKKFFRMLESEMQQGGISDFSTIEVITYANKRTKAYSGWGALIIQQEDGKILSSTEFAQTCDPESWKAKRVVRKLVRRARKVTCF